MHMGFLSLKVLWYAVLIRPYKAETVIFGCQCPGHEIVQEDDLILVFLFPNDTASQFLYKLSFHSKGRNAFSSPVGRGCCLVKHCFTVFGKMHPCICSKRIVPFSFLFIRNVDFSLASYLTKYLPKCVSWSQSKEACVDSQCDVRN